MKIKFLLAALMFTGTSALAQSFAINTTSAAADASSMLDVSSNTKGMLIPRMTSAERTAIVSPATGLVVYDNTLSQFYYYNGTAWTPIAYGSNANNYWTLSGGNIYNNTGTFVGIGLTTPTANLDITGTNAGSNSLLLRSGNTSASTASNQVLFGFNNTTNFKHAIKTRHNSSAATGNAIDFYLWNFGTDASGTTGTKQVMTLDGNGRVGIGTTAPANTLQVVGNGIIGASTNTVSGTNSLATGSSNTVSGNTSLAFGSSNVSLSDNNIVGGSGSRAELQHSIVVGFTDTAQASATAVFGFRNKVTAFTAFAAGDNNKISGQTSAGFGSSNSITGTNSLVAGSSSVISGWQSIAVGSSDSATANGTAVFGYSNTASGLYSFAANNSNKVSGTASSVFGNANTVTGNNNIVGGFSSRAEFDHSVVIGNSDTSQASATAVFGYRNKATGFTSFAANDNNKVSAQSAAAFGFSNNASGDQSFANGIGNYAVSQAETSIGSYGTVYTPVSAVLFNAADRIFNVGNGTGTASRSDAFTILKSGYIGVGNNTPASKFTVNGSIAVATLVTATSLTLDGTQYCVIYTGGTGNTFTLPAANSCTGRIYSLINHGTDVLTVSVYRTGNATTSTSINADSAIQIISDGTEWRSMK